MEDLSQDQLESTAGIAIVPDDMTTGSGQSFQVRLVAESFPDVRNAQITVTYNPQQLVFDKAQPGDFFPRSSRTFIPCGFRFTG